MRIEFLKEWKIYINGGSEMKLKYFVKMFPFIVADVVSYVDDDGNEISNPKPDSVVIDYHFNSGYLEIVI